jgi:hypothetical protein
VEYPAELETELVRIKTNDSGMSLYGGIRTTILRDFCEQENLYADIGSSWKIMRVLVRNVSLVVKLEPIDRRRLYED